MPKSTPELAEMTTGPAGPNESHVLYNQSIQQVKNKQLYIFVGKADFRCNHLLPPHNKKVVAFCLWGATSVRAPFFQFYRRCRNSETCPSGLFHTPKSPCPMVKRPPPELNYSHSPSEFQRVTDSRLKKSRILFSPLKAMSTMEQVRFVARLRETLPAERGAAAAGTESTVSTLSVCRPSVWARSDIVACGNRNMVAWVLLGMYLFGALCAPTSPQLFASPAARTAVCACTGDCSLDGCSHADAKCGACSTCQNAQSHRSLTAYAGPAPRHQVVGDDGHAAAVLICCDDCTSDDDRRFSVKLKRIEAFPATRTPNLLHPGTDSVPGETGRVVVSRLGEPPDLPPPEARTSPWSPGTSPA